MYAPQLIRKFVRVNSTDISRRGGLDRGRRIGHGLDAPRRNSRQPADPLRRPVSSIRPLLHVHVARRDQCCNVGYRVNPRVLLYARFGPGSRPGMSQAPAANRHSLTGYHCDRTQSKLPGLAASPSLSVWSSMLRCRGRVGSQRSQSPLQNLRSRKQSFHPYTSWCRRLSMPSEWSIAVLPTPKARPPEQSTRLGFESF